MCKKVEARARCLPSLINNDLELFAFPTTTTTITPNPLQILQSLVIMVANNTLYNLIKRMVWNESDKVRKFLSSGPTDGSEDDFMANILYQDRFGETTLMLAIEDKAPTDIITSLIEKGGKDLVMMKDDDRGTALHIACHNNPSVEVVKHLLDVGGEELLVIEDEDGKTALNIANEAGSYATEEAQDTIRSFDINMIIKSNRLTVRLLESFVNVHGRWIGALFTRLDDEGSPLIKLIAESNPSVDVIRYILKNGSMEIDEYIEEEYRDEYPTIRSDWNALLENALISDKHDVLMSLVEKEYWKAVRIFMTTKKIQSETRKKNVFYQDSDNDDKNTVLHVAMKHSAPFDVVELLVSKLLLDKGGKDLVMMQTNRGKTALHYACGYGAPVEVVKHLLDVGGEELLVMKDGGDKIALEIANQYNASDEVKDAIRSFDFNTIVTSNRLNLSLLESFVNVHGIDGLFTKLDDNEFSPIVLISQFNSSLDVIGYIIENGAVEMGETEEYKEEYPTIRSDWNDLLERALISATNDGDHDRCDVLMSLVEKEYWEAVRVFMTTKKIRSDTRKKNVFYQDSDNDDKNTVLHVAMKHSAPFDTVKRLIEFGGKGLTLVRNGENKIAYEIACKIGTGDPEIIGLFHQILKPTLIEAGEGQCVINGTLIDLPDKVDGSVAKGVFELILYAARYGVNEGTQARGMIAVIGSSDDFKNIGYCDEGMNTFESTQIDVRKWKQSKERILPCFIKDGAFCVDGETGFIVSDGFIIDIPTKNADKGGGTGHRNASAAGEEGFLAIKCPEDCCTTDGNGKENLKVFPGTKVPTTVPVKPAETS